MTLLRAFWDAARGVAPETAATRDEGVVMRWCRAAELAELWQTVGLRDVQFGPIVVRAHYPGFEDLWSPFPHGVAPCGTFSNARSEHDRVTLDCSASATD